MSDEHMNDKDMDAVLREWTQEAPAGQPDGSRVVGTVVRQLGSTRRPRRRWWPLSVHRRGVATRSSPHATEYQPSPIPASNGHTPTVIGRTQSMFSPAKAITAGALVFALGGVLLIAQPFEQQGGGVPGAATDSEPVDAVEFTATFPWGHQLDSGESPDPSTLVGWTHGTSASESSDPRFEGELVYTWNSQTYPSEGGPPLKVWNGVMRVENDEGAWQSRPANEVEFSDGTWSVFTMVFDGEEGYEGLTAVVEVEEWSTDPRTGGYNWHGVVVGGDLPPDAEQYVGE